MLLITKFVCTGICIYLYLTKDSSIDEDLDLIFKVKADLDLNIF